MNDRLVKNKQLKNCYQLAAKNTTDTVAEILKKKADAIGDTASAFSGISEKSEAEKTSEIFQDIYQDKSVWEIQTELNRLSDSADKYYLMAVNTLRTGTGTEQCTAAAGYLSRALQYGSDEPYIETLAQILAQNVRRY